MGLHWLCSGDPAEPGIGQFRELRELRTGGGVGGLGPIGQVGSAPPPPPQEAKGRVAILVALGEIQLVRVYYLDAFSQVGAPGDRA